jgi:hypothetical protein
VAYLLNLPASIASQEVISIQTLRASHYLGQYGQIQELVLQPGLRGLFNAYVTYDSELSVAKCITGCAGYMLYNATIKASYGTKKFCNFFVNKKPCPKSECGFLHDIGNEEDIVPREALHIGQLYTPKNSVFEKFTFQRERLKEYNTFPPVRAFTRTQDKKRKTYRPVAKPSSDESLTKISRNPVAELRARNGIYNPFSAVANEEECNIEKAVE